MRTSRKCVLAVARPAFGPVLSILTLTFMLAAAPFAFGEAPDIEWTQVVGGSGSDLGYAVDVAHGGGYIVAGKTTSDGAAYIDILLARLDESGGIVWQTNIGGAAEDVCNSVKRTSDGGYVLAGYTGVQPNYIDYYLVKTDAAGDVQWSKTYGSSDVVEKCESVIETSDGGFALAGDAGSAVYLVKTDSEGNLEWEETYSGGNDHCYSLTQTEDGGYALVGWRGTGSLVQVYDMMVVKVDADGELQWRRLYDIGVEDQGRRIVQLPGGDYVVAGSIGNFSLWKLSPGGVLRWQHDYGTPVNDVCLGLGMASDGGYLLGGYTYDYDLGYQFYAVLTDADGALLWEDTYGGSEYDYCWDLTASGDGGWLMVGTTQSYGAGSHDLYALRLGPDPDPTGIAHDGPETGAVSLAAPTPNPSRGRATLSFRLDSATDTSLNVYNVRGERVRALWSGPASAGPHDVEFDGTRGRRGNVLSQGLAAQIGAPEELWCADPGPMKKSGPASSQAQFPRPLLRLAVFRCGPFSEPACLARRPDSDRRMIAWFYAASYCSSC
jgi:hypothetical protein